ncbi:MAG: hypothetical protein K2W92_07960 [Alphaproteobacteria bacterium]|nr:hypothetical protein [Alphaproteobacteria bacterium]
MQNNKYNFSLKLFIFLGFLCSFPSFLFSYNYVLNLFYEYGCPLEDGGMCAYLMWHNVNIQFPPSLSTLWGNAFIASHFCPIFFVTSLLSKVINVSMISFFAYFQGISHGLLALSMFYVLYRLYELNSVFQITLAFFLSILFSFCGIAVSSMYYPHYEVLFIPMAVFFLAFLIQKKPIVAIPFFIISLSIRECTGFHLFSLLFFLVIVDYFKSKKIYKPYLFYAVLAFSYSIFALTLQKYLRKGGICSFTDLYIGTPPFSHISWELIKERAIFIFNNRGYFYIPVTLILIWSIISKKPFISLGVLALIPWFLFNFFSISTWASGLYFYYGVFYLLIFFWPLLIIKLIYSEEISSRIKKEVFIWYSCIILTSVLFNNSFNYKNFILEPGVSQKHIFQRFQTSLLYSLDQLGNVIVDGQVASLVPSSFTKNQILYLRIVSVEARRKFFTKLDQKFKELEKVDSLIFYNYWIEEGLVPFYMILSHLPYMYKIIGTNVYLASNKTLPELPSFSSILVPISYHLEQDLRKQYFSSMFIDAYHNDDVGHVNNDFDIPKKALQGVVVYTNPKRLPKGEYCVQFGIESTAPSDPKNPIFSLDVVSQNEIQVFLKKDVYYQEVNELTNKEMEICFNVNDNLPNALLAIRFWHYQNAGFLIKDPKIYEIYPLKNISR